MKCLSLVCYFCLLFLQCSFAGNSKPEIECFGIAFTQSDSAEFIKWMYSAPENTRIVQEAYQGNKRRTRWKRFGIPAGLGVLGISYIMLFNPPECNKEENPDCSDDDFTSQSIGAVSALGGAAIIYFSIRAYFKKTAEERMLLNKCYFALGERR